MANRHPRGCPGWGQIRPSNGAKSEHRTHQQQFPTITVALQWLRQHGIGILTGEVESSIKDVTLLHDGKFTYESALELQQRLQNGTPVADLVDTTEIKELLTRVLGQIQPQ